MIQTQTVMDVADNSGAKRVAVIKVLGGSRRRYAGLGDIVVVSVKECLPTAKVKKGDVHKAVVVRTKKGYRRYDGSYIKFDTNSAVLLNPQLEPMALRLLARFPRLRSLDMASGGGTAWMCVMQESGPPACGTHSQGGKDRGEQPFVELGSEPGANGHHGIYYLPTISASAPAGAVAR